MTSLSRCFERCEEFLAGVRGYSPDTVANYQRTWWEFLRYVMDRGAPNETRSFTLEHVQGYLAMLGKAGRHPNTMLNRLHGLATLARYLRTQRDGRGRPLLDEDPIPRQREERPREVKPATKYLRPEELQAWLSAPAYEGETLARALLVDTGVRCLEVCQANVGDLAQGAGGTWLLTIPVKGRRQAGAEPAVIPVSPDVAEALTKAVLARGAGAADPLIVDVKGKRFRRTQLTQAMIRLGQKAGITRLTTSPHKARHTANVVARLSGVDALTRAAMLNHRSMRTLARYDHLCPEETAKGRAAMRRGYEEYLSRPETRQLGQPLVSPRPVVAPGDSVNTAI